MIEHQYEDHPRWYKTDSLTPYNELTFSNYVIKINGETFTEQSDEFIKAIEADKFWDKLQQ